MKLLRLLRASRRRRSRRAVLHYVERLDAWWWRDREFDTWHVYLPDTAADTRVFTTEEAAFACLRAYGAEGGASRRRERLRPAA